MAALDFPSSPTTGQIFVGGNGVSYQYNGTLWLASGASAGGDFCAIYSSGIVAYPAAVTTMIFNTVFSGNTGSWYNTTNGRYTPPAGRYYLEASMIVVGSSASVAHATMQLRKNGVVLPGFYGVLNISGGDWSETMMTSGIIDANGSDYFDVVIQSGQVPAPRYSNAGTYFLAYPISGIKGPPGDAGPPGSVPTGDFCANQTASFPGLLNTGIQLFPTPVITGNAGTWYDVGTGRYIPPAGRYCINASFTASYTAASNMTLTLRKNGVTLLSNVQTTTAASAFSEPTVSLIVDATGTDYFTIHGASSAGTGTLTSIVFQGYPISGIKGPPGDLVTATGVIVDFAGSTAPSGWLICDGASYTTAAQAALFAVIGYTYGGSGSNFNVPDLGGRVTAGKEATATRLTAAVSGINGAVLGAAGGGEGVTLSTAQMPAHNHGINGQASGTFIYQDWGGGGVGTYPGTNMSTAGLTTATMGSSAVHQNTQPTMVMNKIIKT